ncbi:MAG TPA: TonB-dependent receptor plug domain-containing protein [Caulobacteraceae bacterium]
MASGLWLAILSGWAGAASAASPPTPDPGSGKPETGQAVVSVVTVIGHREPGEIAGSTPILQLGSADIAGFGASSLGELLRALALETSGADGSAPVLLLNGVRIASATQLRDLPPEALKRVEVYSGDTAVRFGYGPQQRVLNFVLRPNYSDIAAEGGAGIATDGGGASERYRLGLDRIRSGQRFSLTATYDHADWLFESQRPIMDGFGDFRTLAPATDHAVLNGVYAATFGGVSASLDASVGGNWSASRLGPRADDVLLEGAPLARTQSNLNAHVGLALNGNIHAWTWSLVGNADHNHGQTFTDSNTSINTSWRDLTRSTQDRADADLLFFGPVAKLPAGELTASVDLGIDGQREDDLDRGLGGDVRSSVRFAHRKIEASLEVPLAGHSGPLAPIGNLSVSFSYGRDWFSDFHGLDNNSVSLIWRPSPRLNFVVTRNTRASAPTIDQLGAPVLAMPNVTIFDFVRGETVDVARIDGGVPGLAPERDTTTSVSMQLRPIPSQQFIFSFNFTDTHSQGTIGSPAVASLAFEQAFPARFVRDATGRLVTVDARPINFAAGDEQQIRWGFNLVEPLARADGPAATERSNAATGGGFAAAEARDKGLRLQLSVYHTWRLQDRLQLSPGAAKLDFLRGDVGPGATGKPQHEVEVSADLNRGVTGAELTGTWKSGARLYGSGTTSDQITVSPLLVINVKLHAGGPADGPPALRGVLFSLSVDNLFDNRPQLRNASGAMPIAYQPDYMDPLGRVVRISARKLF